MTGFKSKNTYFVFILALFGAVVLAVVFAGSWYLRKELKESRSEAVVRLRALTELKSARLQDWLKERYGDATFLLRNREISQLTLKLTDSHHDKKIDSLVSFTLFSMYQNNHYSRIAVVDTNFQLLFSYPYDSETQVWSGHPEIVDAFQKHAVVMSDFQRNHNHAIRLRFIVPIYYPNNGKKLATILLEVDPYTYFYPMLQKLPLPSRSSECELVRRDGDSLLFLNDLNRPGSALTFRKSLLDTLSPSVHAIRGKTDVAEGVDYRGETVLACASAIPGTAWYLIIKIDTEEVYSDKNKDTIAVFIIVSMVILIIAVLSAFLWKQYQVRFLNERLEQELKLHDNEQRLRLALAVSQMGEWELNLTDHGAKRSPRHDQIFGYETMLPEWTFEKFIEHVIPEDRVFVEQKFQKAIETKSSWDFECRIKRADNLERWILAKGQMSVDLHGQPVKLTGIVQDITDIKLAGEEHLLNEKRMQLAMEGTNTGLWDWDLVSDTTYYSPSWLQLLGYSQQEIAEDNTFWIRTMHPEDVTILRAALDRHLHRETPICEIEYQKLKKNGDWIWVLDCGKVVDWSPEGKPLRMIGTITDITKRKQTETALVKSEERFNLAVSGSSVGIWDFDLVNNSVYFSTRCKELLGYPADYPIDKGINEWLERIHPDDMSRVMETYNEFLSGKSGYDINQRLLNSSGKYRWYNTRGLCVKREDGTPIRLVGSVMDIHDQMTFAKKLEESTEQIQKQLHEIDQIYSNSPVGLFALDKEFRYVHINDVLAQINGLTVNAHIGKTIEEVLPDLWGTLKEMFTQIIEKGVSFLNNEVSGKVPLMPNETRYWLASYYPNLSDNGEVIGVLGSVMDITERIQADEKIRESEKRYRSLFANMLEGFAYCQMIYENDVPSDFKYLAVNNAFEHLTGLKNVEGRLVSEVIPGIQATNGDLFERYGQVASTGIPEQFETFVSGLGIWFSISVYSTEPGYFIAVFDNITDRKVAEENIIQLNRELEERVAQRTASLETANKELEAFSYSVSHDLRAPLRSIDGFSRIILEEYDSVLDAEGKRLFGVVRSNTQRMGVLIDDLLSLSRVGRNTIESTRVDMTAMARAMFYETSTDEQRSGIEFTLSNLPYAWGDAVLLRQVWANLLSNAIKYSSQRSNAKIEVYGTDDPTDFIFSVKDNGVGYDPQYSSKLFGVFQRLHSSASFEGTGVGLAIVKRIIERHHGRVWSEGELNKGATFYFSLPKNGDQNG